MKLVIMVPGNCTGERRLMNNNMYAECISYKSYKNINIMLEDGTIVENKTKSSLLKNSIVNPNFK